MQARRLPARQGALWLVAGLRLLRANPSLLTLLTLGYLLLALAINLLPMIGPFLLPIVLPALTLFVANGCRAIEQGTPRPAAHLGAHIRDRRIAMLQLGVLQLLGSAAVFGISSLFGIGTGIPVDPRLAPGETAWMLLRLLVLAAPVVIAFWFAPLLAGWDGVPPLKSVFFSTVATLRNWRAFVSYGLCVAAFCIGFPALTIGLASLLSPALATGVAAVVRLILVFILAPVLMSTGYFSYRDVFAHE